jgi:hypothetical protein
MLREKIETKATLIHAIVQHRLYRGDIKAMGKNNRNLNYSQMGYPYGAIMPGAASSLTCCCANSRSWSWRQYKRCHALDQLDEVSQRDAPQYADTILLPAIESNIDRKSLQML